MISTFNIRFNDTNIYTAPTQFNSISQFGIVLPNENENYTVLKFMLKGIATGTPFRTPSDEELETLPVNEI